VIAIFQQDRGCTPEAYRLVIQAAHDQYAVTKDDDELQKMWDLTLDDVLRHAARLNDSAECPAILPAHSAITDTRKHP